MLDEKISLAARDRETPVIVAVCETPGEHRELGMHSHARGQVAGLRRGLLTIGTEEGSWVVPAHHAVWLPPHQPHYGYSHGSHDGWLCYIAESACAALPTRPCTINASGLLREAVIRASGWQGDGELDEAQRRIAMIILDELRAAPVEPFGLPMPKDPRLVLVARTLLADPGDRRGLDAWASFAATSERTLSRRFVEETGYSFTAWRQRARLMRALELLADEVPVTTVALDLGYDSVSAFITLFKRVFGVTPSACFDGNPPSLTGGRPEGRFNY